MNPATARTSEPLPVWSGRSKQRNWLFVGLILSLILHGLLCFFFYRTGFQASVPLGVGKRQPPTFKVTSVDTAAKPLDQAAASSATEAAKPNPDKTDVQLPDDQKSFDKLLQEETGLPVHVAEDPLSAVAEGTGKALQELKFLKAVASYDRAPGH